MQQELNFDTSLLKALFKQLRQVIGSQDAAAAYLNVSRQRVAQLEGAKHPEDVPTWAQVFTLEQEAGRSIVFAALAAMSEAKAPTDIMDASIAAVTASSAALQATADMMADLKVEPHELPGAIEAARRNREAAARQVTVLERHQALLMQAAGEA